MAVGRPARCVNCARLFIFSDSRARDACKCTAYVFAVEHFARSGKSRVGAMALEDIGKIRRNSRYSQHEAIRAVN